MEAKLKESYRWKVAQVAGFELIKGEFRVVPLNAEGEIKASPLVDIKKVRKPRKKVVEEVAEEPVDPEVDPDPVDDAESEE
jgi:hypothetical protein